MSNAKTKPKPKAKPVPGVYYREDGQPRWEVKIRWIDKKGIPRRIKTHRYPVDPKALPKTTTHIDVARKAAEAYASREWNSIATTGKSHSMRADAWTLRALLEKYLEELEEGVIKPKAAKTERSSIRMLLGMGKGHNKAGFKDLVDSWIADLDFKDFVGPDSNSLQMQLKDNSGNRAGTSSLKRVLTVVRCVFVRAKDVWNIELTNPLQTIKGLTIDDARERIITDDEWEKITKELEAHEQGTLDAIVFARFTAARRAEVVKLDWKDIDFAQKTARLRETKSRVDKVIDRTIPLPAVALDIVLRRSKMMEKTNQSFPVFTTDKGVRVRADTLTQAWTRACKRAGVKDARVHDLRHTRITELGRFLTAAEAARVSGHTDLATFFRYFNPDAAETGKKIDAMERGVKDQSGIGEAARALAALSNADFAAAITQAVNLRFRHAAGK